MVKSFLLGVAGHCRKLDALRNEGQWRSGKNSVLSIIWVLVHMYIYVACVMINGKLVKHFCFETPNLQFLIHLQHIKLCDVTRGVK